MAHEIEDNRAFFVGQPAWHGLGTVVTDAPSTHEAIGLAGLDHTVSLVDLVAAGQTLTGKAVLRSDGKIVGEYVGPDFALLQPSEAFSWFDPFLETGLCQLEAAGSLRGGSRMWVLAKVTGCETEITAGDSIERYLLLAHAYDGTMAVRAGPTDVRVVCANTLSAALSEGGGILKIRHTSGMHAALASAADLIAEQMRGFATKAQEMRQLAAASCTDEQCAQLIRQVFQPSSDPTDPKVAKTQVNRILPLFQGAGSGLALPGVSGTYWAAFNAVTEFLTHGRGRSADTRVDSQWFGQGAEMTNRAYRVARSNAAGRSMSLSA